LKTKSELQNLRFIQKKIILYVTLLTNLEMPKHRSAEVLVELLVKVMEKIWNSTK
jgi:hypothetical protein